jgi:hypothetical protein
MHALHHTMRLPIKQQNSALKQRETRYFMRLDLGDIQPFHQPTQLARRDLDRNLRTVCGPPESLFFKASIEQPESVVVPLCPV